jgi:hypothetical protein
MAKRILASDLGKLAYCEQKLRFDSVYGDRAPERVRKLRDSGTAAHSRFETEGRGGDRRCFVATCIYGSDAIETNALRSFRDRTLLPSPAGRFLVAIYYSVSPHLVPILERFPGLAAGVRKLLNAIVRRLP